MAGAAGLIRQAVESANELLRVDETNDACAVNFLAVGVKKKQGRGAKKTEFIEQALVGGVEMGDV